MDRNDAKKVIDNLQQKPFICGEDEILVSGGYVIIKKNFTRHLRKSLPRGIERRRNDKAVFMEIRTRNQRNV